MGYQVYMVGKRYGGYGVPSYCEHPKCDEEIDRGVSYACGGEPFSELGCDRYFCGKHRDYESWDGEKGAWCQHTHDCDCEGVEVCYRCANDKDPFDYKPEHPDWIEHLLNDESWADWRKNNKDEVKELQNAK